MMANKWFRNYGIYYKHTPTRVMAVEALIARLMNIHNKSRSKAIVHIFEAGLETLGKDPTIGSVEIRESLARARLYDRARIEAARRREFQESYKELGVVRMQELAQEEGIDLSNELNKYTRPVSSRFDEMKVWILEHLSDGLPHTIEGVRKAAIHDGVLTNPSVNSGQYEKDHRNFKAAASMLGVSGKHTKRGEWQKAGAG